MGKIFSPSKPKAIPAAVVKPIPAQDTMATDTAKKKAAAAQQQRGGVAATVLSDTLGG